MERATLRELLNYEPDKHLSEDELELIRNTFKYNPKLLPILRKVFLPTVSDAQLPPEEFTKDVFNAGKLWDQLPADEAKILIVARQDAISFVMGGLIMLRNLATQTEETDEERKERRKKDSVK